MKNKFCFVLISFAFSVSSYSLSKRLSGTAQTSNEQLRIFGNKINQYGIKGGKNITIDKANYVGSILSDDSLQGSVIVLNSKWLLTAAFNLLFYTSITIRLGSSYSDHGGQEITIFDVNNASYVHPNYTGQWKYDIALIKLKEALKFGKNIQPIKLSSKLPKNRQKVKVSGFGAKSWNNENQLVQAVVNFLDYKHCKTHYKSESEFNALSFCSSTEDVGPCPEDWGSPLVYQKKLIGVFSGSYECGGTNYPAVYSNILKFKPWIHDTIKHNSN